MAAHAAIETTDNLPTAIDDYVPLTEAELDRIVAAGSDPKLGTNGGGGEYHMAH
jgi:hypothetical protein